MQNINENSYEKAKKLVFSQEDKNIEKDIREFEHAYVIRNGVEELKKLAKSGHPQAQLDLAILYMKDRKKAGIKCNTFVAFEFSKMSQDQGSEVAAQLCKQICSERLRCSILYSSAPHLIDTYPRWKDIPSDEIYQKIKEFELFQLKYNAFLKHKELSKKQADAFCMGTHRRLGSESEISKLPVNITKLILHHFKIIKDKELADKLVSQFDMDGKVLRL